MARKPILSNQMRLFLFAMILANLGGTMFFPFFAIYLSKLGLDVGGIGVFFTVSALFPLAFEIFGGWLSDRLGRLASVAIGSVAGALSWVAMVAAPATPWPLAVFLASNAIGAVTSALVGPSFEAYTAEQAGEENRGKVFGLVQSIFLVVGIAGPPAGGWIAERFGYASLAWVSAILYWSATVVRVLMARKVASASASKAASGSEGATGIDAAPAAKSPVPTFGQSLKAILGLIVSGGLFMWLFIMDGVFDISGKLSGDLLPLYLKQVGGQSESGIGILQAISALSMALVMTASGAFADRKGERLPILAGCVLAALSTLILWLGHSFEAFAASFLVSGLAGAAVSPAMQSLTSKAVPPELRGMAYGFLGSSIGFFSLAAPAVGAWLWKAYFPALPFLVTGALSLLAALPAFSRLTVPAAEAAVKEEA